MRIALSYQSEKATVVTGQRRKAQIFTHCTPLSRKDTNYRLSATPQITRDELLNQTTKDWHSEADSVISASGTFPNRELFSLCRPLLLSPSAPASKTGPKKNRFLFLSLLQALDRAYSRVRFRRVYVMADN